MSITGLRKGKNRRTCPGHPLAEDCSGSLARMQARMPPRQKSLITETEIAAPPSFSRVSGGIRLVLRQGYSWISLAQRRSKVRLSAGGPKKEVPMATFVVLATFSEQGIKNVKQTIERA